MSTNYYNEYRKYKAKYLSTRASNVVEIYLVRHGQTEWNRLGKGQGQEADIPLNDTGKREATETGLYLKEYRVGDKEFDCVYVSPMKRTKETAEIICSTIGYNNLDIVYDKRLKENKRGKLSGAGSGDEVYDQCREMKRKLTSNDPIERYKNYDNMMGFINTKLDIGMETEIEAGDRIYEFIKKVLKSKSNKKILIVAHGGILMCLLKKIFNINANPKGKLKNGGNCWIAYLTFSNGEFYLESPPNNEHLYGKN